MALFTRFDEVGLKLTAVVEQLLKRYPAAKTEFTYAALVTDEETARWAQEGKTLRALIWPDLPKWTRLTRAHNDCRWPFSLLLFEKYGPQAAIPPADWIRKRVVIVDEIMTKIAAPDFKLDVGLTCSASESECTVFVDQAELREEGCFWTELSLTYKEVLRV